MNDISLPSETLPLPVPGFLMREMWIKSKNMHVSFGRTLYRSTVFVTQLNLLVLSIISIINVRGYGQTHLFETVL